MLSFDPRQLELVSQFSNFLQLLADKDALLKIIQDAKDVLEANKAILGPVRTKEEADAYLTEAADKYSKAQELIKQDFAKADAEIKVLRDEAEKERNEAHNLFSQALLEKAKLEESHKILSAELNKVQELKLEAEAKVAAADAIAKENVATQAILAEKLLKIQAVLGE